MQKGSFYRTNPAHQRCRDTQHMDYANAHEKILLNRAIGAAEKERIQADADKQREVILAEAYKEAQQIKGAADAKATAIYSAAYGQNAEFYSFYRSLEAYKQSFKSKSDVLVLEPNADFFKYLKSPTAGKSGK